MIVFKGLADENGHVVGRSFEASIMKSISRFSFLLQHLSSS